MQVRLARRLNAGLIGHSKDDVRKASEKKRVRRA
jgi:hypothetical protein